MSNIHVDREFTIADLQELSVKMSSVTSANGITVEAGEKMKRFISELVEQNAIVQQNRDSFKAAFLKVSDEFKKLWAMHKELQQSAQQKQVHCAKLELELKEKNGQLQVLQDSLDKSQKDMKEIEASIKAKLTATKEKLLDTVKKHNNDKVNLCHLQAKLKCIEDCWKVSHKDVLKTDKKLGDGGYAAVYEGWLHNQKVAIKQLHQIIVSDTNIEKIHDEINTMSRLRHPNLVLFIGAVFDHPSGNPLIITELMDMSLRDAYEKKLLTSEREKLVIMRDAAAGLNYLHCLPDPIIHRDVSSSNVLLISRGSGQWMAKISDFGSAKLVCDAKTANPGAYVYSAPETFQAIAENVTKKQTTKLDIYSFGVLLCEVMACRFPTSPNNFNTMKKQLSQPVCHLIGQCIQSEPISRPAMAAVISKIDSHIESL